MHSTLQVMICLGMATLVSQTVGATNIIAEHSGATSPEEGSVSWGAKGENSSSGNSHVQPDAGDGGSWRIHADVQYHMDSLFTDHPELLRSGWTFQWRMAIDHVVGDQIHIYIRDTHDFLQIHFHQNGLIQVANGLGMVENLATWRTSDDGGEFSNYRIVMDPGPTESLDDDEFSLFQDGVPIVSARRRHNLADATGDTVEWGSFKGNNISRWSLARFTKSFSPPPEKHDAGRPTVFKDVTEEVGLVRDGTPAAWGDFNQDGFVDLYLNGSLWRNEGGRSFTKIENTGITAHGRGIWGDFDNDGRVDLCGFRHGKLYRNLGDGRFQESLMPQRPTEASNGAVWGDFDGDSFLDLYVGGYETPQDYQHDAIYRNKGDGTFELIWTTPGRRRPARGITATDFDEDGDLDVYVSNYRLEPNLLYQNDGNGAFMEVGKEFGVWGDGSNTDFGHTIGSCWGDLDNDGHVDLFIGNFSHPPRHQDRPKFMKNLGPEHGFRFEDKTVGAGLHWQESYASPALGDYDNDGDLDLYLTTVYSRGRGGIENRPVLYRNDGGWRFIDVTKKSGLSLLPRTHQAAWADYDNDGDLDLITADRLFRNEGTSHHWLKIRLVGAGNVNRSAIGAQVRIRLVDRILTRHVETGTGAGNQHDPTLHFGLGSHADKVELEILWPHGSVQKITTDVDRTIIVKSDGTVLPLN